MDVASLTDAWTVRLASILWAAQVDVDITGTSRKRGFIVILCAQPLVRLPSLPSPRSSSAPPSRPPPAPFAFSHRAALARRFPYVSVPLRRHAFLSCCLRRRRRLSSSTAASSLICHCRGPSHLFPVPPEPIFT
ncbi:hypothetical protein OPV22_034585 [Ensete ventricosum]|uniref:Uncharacterized protein n=1 Tax=Ensete ventricosum TaxID=4639 RepID=A0AAV8PXD8_ENSVE|nr:hypothetical protein OPV22_034585 [Ensete ventricosum]